jgi:hypothetical protein
LVDMRLTKTSGSLTNISKPYDCTACGTAYADMITAELCRRRGCEKAD